jgi:diguanylate cyclase (GGDEF)-like protein/PAS domain S-box-containing protein
MLDNVGISFSEFLIIIVILVISIFSLWLAFHLMFQKPIREIIRKINKIAQGDIPIKEYIGEPENPDLANMVRPFNQLISRLNLMNEEMEERVNERTKLLEDASRLVQEVLDTTPNLLCLLNVEIDVFNYVNQEFSDFFGFSNDELLELGPVFMQGRVFPTDKHIYASHSQKLQYAEDNEVIQSEFRMMNHSGEPRWISFRSLIFQRAPGGNPKLVLYVGQDITEFKNNEERLRYLSIHDQLTSLYNRLYFEEEIIRLERGRSYPISTIMGDLDDLKHINDAFGHAAGDKLLQQAASIFRSCFRGEDVVARIGGDEFAALLPGASHETASRVMERINSKFNQSSSNVNGLPVSISIGMATTEKGGSLNAALKLADESMYTAKQKKKQVNQDVNCNSLKENQ